MIPRELRLPPFLDWLPAPVYVDARRHPGVAGVLDQVAGDNTVDGEVAPVIDHRPEAGPGQHGVTADGHEQTVRSPRYPRQAAAPDDDPTVRCAHQDERAAGIDRYRTGHPLGHGEVSADLEVTLAY
jgi:hypothetical protein